MTWPDTLREWQGHLGEDLREAQRLLNERPADEFAAFLSHLNSEAARYYEWFREREARYA